MTRLFSEDPNYDSRDETDVRPQVGFRLKNGAYDSQDFFRDLGQRVRIYHDLMVFDTENGEVRGTVRFAWGMPPAVVDQAADYLRSLPFVIGVFPGYGYPVDAA
jgi:hypothetical protein